MSYIKFPKNKEVENEDYVLRVAIKNLHVSGGYVSPELYLLRARKDKKDEESISVLIEKQLAITSNLKDDAINSVPPPPNNHPERTVFKLNAGELRELLVGVTHTPSKNNDAHGSLHGYFNLIKAEAIKEIAVEVDAVVEVNKSEKK
ncbi:hypothetical protein [Fluviicola sp.]|jgi:hypothetical protein|uniref:hypothetical protein n=1 Tax=Fluviicola sp. TaxID=1917219 RepID=UPI00281ADA3B|nr:hypothetical protein [Fluviicola sp.]MDR0801229.1 hypothetical protein [Fluviicola sp.]